MFFQLTLRTDVVALGVNHVRGNVWPILATIHEDDDEAGDDTAQDDHGEFEAQYHDDGMMSLRDKMLRAILMHVRKVVRMNTLRTSARVTNAVMNNMMRSHITKTHISLTPLTSSSNAQPQKY